MPSPSPPPSSDEEGDHEYIVLQDSEQEQPNIRVPTVSLASRFKSLCKASPPPSQSTQTVSAPPPQRRIVKPKLTNLRSSVRSCDQCRSAKQRCDRNKPCAACAMRGMACTWSQAGGHEAAARPSQLEANRAEIIRLRREVATLSKVLRLTPHELESMAIEAKRLAEGGPLAIRPDQLGHKRFRDANDNIQGRIETGPPSKAQKLDKDRRPAINPSRPTSHSKPQKSASTSPVLLRPIARSLPPLPSSNRTTFEMPVVRLNSSCSQRAGTSTSPAHRVATDPRNSSFMNHTSSSSSTDRPRPVPRSSFSTLPPLKIPSLVHSRQQHLTPSLTSALSSPHLRSALASSSNPSSSARRPHYVLPTPVYSSTPTSASFLPLSTTARSKGFESLSSFTKTWPSLSSSQEAHVASPRLTGMVQPYTPISAVRDEKRESDGGEGMKTNIKKEVVEEGEDEGSRSLSPGRRVVTPILRNLLNDD